MLDDQTSSDEQITKRLEYLEALCRNVIRGEIESYVKDLKYKQKEEKRSNKNS